MKEAEFLTLDELIKVNIDALKNFKDGDDTLIKERRSNDPTGEINLFDYDVQDIVIELTSAILEEVSSSSWEGIGLAEEIKVRFYNLHRG